MPLRPSLARLGTVAAVLAATALPAGPAAAAHDVTPARVAGVDRYATAAEVARLLKPSGSTDAVLAAAHDFPDALAGAPLAGAKDAPVLLTGRTALPAATAQALSDLGVDRVTILGGTSAVGPAVEAQLRDAGYLVERVAGGDRFATAAAVARAVYAENAGGNFPSARRAVFVANGLRFPDALAASAPAAAGPAQIPIVLVASDRVPAVTAQVLRDLQVDLALVVGGPAAVSESVRQALERSGVNTVRIGGQTRTDTATSVAAFAQEYLGFDAHSLLLARGDDFADALAAGPLGGARRDPLLLTRDVDGLSPPTARYLATQCGAVQVVRAVGGREAVSTATLEAAEVAAEDCHPEPPLAEDGQTYIVAPQEPLSFPAGAEVQFDVPRRYDGQPFTGPVDVALVPCANADIVGAARDVFADRDRNGVLDGLGTSDSGAAAIIGVNGAPPSTSPVVVRGVGPDGDGDLDVSLRSSADCAVVLVWHDADGDGQFDVTGDGFGAEPYGVGQVEWA